jgi:ABC-type antimicrobial peptide transport system permease subunit
VLALVGRESRGWVPPNTAIARFTKPVRPAEIINARSLRSAPLFVGGLLVVAATVGLGVAIIISVRARRREMAILQTLGFTGRQLRGSVRVQALAMMFGGFVVGAPLGIVIGRTAWRAFATRLGVAPTTTIPMGWIALTAVGAAAVALLAASGPARGAARAKPSVSLRSE